jgi:hypothetical protein
MLELIPSMEEAAMTPVVCAPPEKLSSTRSPVEEVPTTDDLCRLKLDGQDNPVQWVQYIFPNS